MRKSKQRKTNAYKITRGCTELRWFKYNDLDELHKKTVFILTDLKKWCFDVSLLTSNYVNIYFWDWEKLILLNELMSQIFCFLSLLNSSQSNDFLPKSNFKTNFVFF